MILRIQSVFIESDLFTFFYRKKGKNKEGQEVKIDVTFSSKYLALFSFSMAVKQFFHKKLKNLNIFFVLVSYSESKAHFKTLF